MKPLKVVHSDPAPETGAKKKSHTGKIILALFLSLVVIVAAFFAVYFVSRAMGEGQKNDSNLRAGATTEMTIPAGGACLLTLPDDVDVLDVTFSSSDDKIARVDPSGKVDGLAEGKAKITAKAEGFEASCNFTVEKAAEQPAEVTTAYTANADVLSKNIEKSKDNLYCLVVNRKTNTVTVYTYDDEGKYSVPVRAMVCSCGAGGENETPVGEYKTASTSEWASLYGDDDHETLFGQYATEFHGAYLFHSVPYEEEKKDALEPGEFNKLGTNASQGCVRLMVADCYWIYKNCAKNTPVFVIDEDASSDPLGTPPIVKKPANGGWDPTDPDPKNPYKGKLPSIGKAEDVTLKKGEKFDPMKGIIAKDICGNIINDEVEVIGKVLTDKPGTYYLTYTVTDAFHLTRSVIRTVVVK